MPTNVRDPRSIITPGAFKLDESLLGTPLAKPWTRLVALVIDIAVIGVLNVFTSGFGILIWGAVGIFLVHLAFRSPGTRMGQFTSILFRGSTGCLGFTVLLVVGLVGLANVVDTPGGDGPERDVSGADVLRTLGRVGVLSGLGGLAELESVQSEEEARRILVPLVQAMDDLGMSPGEQMELLEDAVADDLEFSPDPEAFIASLVRRPESEPAAPAPEEISSEELEAVGTLTLPEALDRYREGLEEGADPAVDPVFAALQTRVVELVAADTLGHMEAALAEERDRRERAQNRAQSALDELASRESGFWALLRDIWDQAGSVVGLWSIYFTVALSVFRGFTVGKRVMGIRVIRLDGQPLNWWAALERAGGYVAGVATGFLGFAQIFWDPNRQCVHDKIGGTVVVVAGAAADRGAAASAWRPENGPEAD